MPTNDVCQKIKEAQPIKNGYVVTGVRKNGSYNTLAPNINKTRTCEDLENRYTNRFDDEDYYN